jgi:ABC-type Fe3+-hydroxamate transport system substrate-binding protein
MPPGMGEGGNGMSLWARATGAAAVLSVLALTGCTVDGDKPAPATSAQPEAPAQDAAVDADLTKAVEAYCADRTTGPGPDIPQLMAAGLLPSDWAGTTDVVLNPTSGQGQPCGSGAGTYTFWTPGPTTYPLAVTGCNGVTSTFNSAPQRALSVDQTSYQLALALGLDDEVYGFWPTRTDDLREDLKPLKVINQESHPLDFAIDSDGATYQAAGMGDTIDHSEKILVFGPDFIFTGDWFGWPMAFGWDGPTPMEKDASEIAPTYMGFTNNGWFCEATGDGSYDKKAGWVVVAPDARAQDTFEYLYADIRNLGMIFDAQDEAFALISSLKEQVAEALVTADGRGEGLSATTLLVGYGDTVPASWDADKALYYSRRDPLNAALAQLGVTNVWAEDASVANMTTVESFIAKKPDIIVMESVYGDCHDVREFIEGDPTWAQSGIPAIAEDRLVCAQFKDAYLGLGLPDILRAVADTVAAG